jgi:Protein of unknown function (DUF2971)
MVNIPRELLEAAGQFRLWATDLMHSEQEDKKITQPLYHYTDATGLKGIIEKEEIWFTSHRYMNDPSEISFGIDAAHKAIKRVPTHGWLTQIFLDTLADGLNVQTIDLEYFLAGFSYARDDLGQWRAYGCNGRGFALGLAPKLFAVVDETSGMKITEKIAVHPVEYGMKTAIERHSQVIKKAVDIFSDVVAKHSALLQDKDLTSRFISNYIGEIFTGALLFVCLTSKHEAYEHEREVRLMMLGLRNKFEPFIETRVRNDELVAFVRHPMPSIKEPESIVEIVMGPFVGLDAEHAVRSLLSSAKCPRSVPINRSSIPYRAR